MNNLVFLFLVIAISMMFCYTILMAQENKAVITHNPRSTHPLAGRTTPGNLPFYAKDLSDILKNIELYGGFGNAGQGAFGTGMSAGAFTSGG